MLICRRWCCYAESDSGELPVLPLSEPHAALFDSLLSVQSYEEEQPINRHISTMTEPSGSPISYRTLTARNDPSLSTPVPAGRHTGSGNTTPVSARGVLSPSRVFPVDIDGKATDLLTESVPLRPALSGIHGVAGISRSVSKSAPKSMTSSATDSSPIPDEDTTPVGLGIGLPMSKQVRVHTVATLPVLSRRCVIHYHFCYTF